MKTWTISSAVGGVVLGTYQAETAEDALDALARDASYRDHADACAQSADDGAHLVVTEVATATPATA